MTDFIRFVPNELIYNPTKGKDYNKGLSKSVLDPGGEESPPSDSDGGEFR